MTKPAAWTGLCPGGHGLDYEGQKCNVCAHEDDPSLTPETCPQEFHCRVCWKMRGDRYCAY